ncbi:MAG: trigger factor [Lachnospiraceae bacterium]|nr:trigger factor [Lachnospiraceae bacterium]
MTRKNMLKAGLAMAAAMVVMTGCGNKAATETTAATTAAVVEETTAVQTGAEASLVLGEYKGLTHTKVVDEVTDGEVEAQIHNYAAQYPPRKTDRLAKAGDTANIDYEGKIDGVAFQGGAAYSHDLALGSGEFINGFEEAVIGMMPGEEKDIPLKFPEDYHNTEVAGKDTIFHVKLNYVTNPDEIEVNDELAQRVTYKKDLTLDEWRQEIRTKMEINAEVYYYLESAAELLTQIVEDSEITVDEKLAKERVEEFRNQYTAQAMLYGMDYKTFLSSFMATTPEQAEADVVNSIREEMVMNEIIKLENIQATEEQKQAVARINGCDDPEHLVSRYGEEQAEKMYGMYAGIFFLIENAVK